MQELWPVVQVRDAGTQTGRMLLRARLHVRSVLQVPRVVRLFERRKEVIA